MTANHRFLRSVSILVLLSILLGLLPPSNVLASPAAPKKEAKRVRELVERRTSNAKFFINDDGTPSAEIFSSGAHVKDDKGRWVDLDYKLRKVGNSYQAGNGKAKITFHETSTGQPAAIAAEGYEMSVGLVGSASMRFANLPSTTQSPSITASAYAPPVMPSAAPAPPSIAASVYTPPVTITSSVYSVPTLPTLVDSTPVPQITPHTPSASAIAIVDDYNVAYREVLPKVDLEYEVRTNGFKETIVIRDNTAPNQFTFKIRAEGLRLALDQKERSLVATDAKGNPVFDVAKPIAWDAKGRITTGISVAMAEAEEKSAWLVTYTLSRHYMDDPKVVYPLKLDPTVSFRKSTSDSSEVTLYGAYRLQHELGVGGQWHVDDGRPPEHYYVDYFSSMKFTLNDIPPGNVTSAKMRMYMEPLYVSPSFGCTIKRCTQDWNEWNGPPYANATLETQWFSMAASRWVDFNVTETVQNWLTNTWLNYGFSFWNANQTDQRYNFRTVHHADPLYWPRLLVTYVPQYDATWLGYDGTTTMTPGQEYRVRLSIMNSGTMVWPKEGTNAVKLSYHWVDDAGNVVIQNGVQSGISADVPQNAVTTVEALVHGPPSDGQYTLRWDLYQPGINRWFSSVLAPTLDVRVNDSNQVLRNPYFTADSNNDGLADNWLKSGDSNVSVSRFTREGFGGWAQKARVTGNYNGSFIGFYQNSIDQRGKRLSLTVTGVTNKSQINVYATDLTNGVMISDNVFDVTPNAQFQKTFTFNVPDSCLNVQIVAQAMRGYFWALDDYFTLYAATLTPTGQLLSNCYFMTDADSNGLADGWVKINNQSTSYAYLTSGTSWGGRVQVVVPTSFPYWDGAVGLYQQGINRPGRQLTLRVRGVTSGSSVTLQAKDMTNGGTTIATSTPSVSPGSFDVHMTFAVPSNCTNLRVSIASPAWLEEDLLQLYCASLAESSSVAPVVSVTSPIASAGPINLLTPNQADVETDLTGISVWGQNSTPTLLRDTTTAKRGAASAKAVATSNGSFDIYMSSVPGLPGETYTFSAWAKFQGGQGRQYGAVIDFYGTAGYLGSAPSGLEAATNDWTKRLVATGVAPAGTTQVVGYVIVFSALTGETLWYDSGQMEKGDTATAWLPPGTRRGGSVSKSVKIAAAVQGMTPTSVEFYVDGTLKSTVTSALYEYTWDTTQYPKGEHTVTVKANGPTIVWSQPVEYYVNNDVPLRLGLESFWHYTQIPIAGGTAYVNAGGGNLLYQNVRLAIPGRMTWVTLRHTYNSQEDHSDSFYGRGWDIGPNIRLEIAGNGDVTQRFGDGVRRVFVKKIDGSFAPPVGVHDSLAYRSDGKYEIVTPRGLRYLFSDQGGTTRRLMSITDRNGNITQYAWNPNGSLQSITEPANRQIALTYDANNRISSITDWSGRVVTLTVDSNGYLTQARYQNEGQMVIETYGYTNERLSSVSGPRQGQLTSFSYDASWRVTQVNQKLNLTENAIWNYSYHSSPARTVVIDPLNRKSTFYHNDQGNLTAFENPLRYRSVYEWAGNKVTSAIAPDTQALLTPWFTADSNGDGVADNWFQAYGGSSAGASWRIENHPGAWGGKAQKVQIESACTANLLGVGQNFEVNSGQTFTVHIAGRSSEPTVKIRVNQSTPWTHLQDQTFTVTPNEDFEISYTFALSPNYTRVQVMALVDWGGSWSVGDYVQFHSITATKNSKRSFTYDAMGNTLSASDAYGNTTRWTYDALNNPLTKTDALGNKTSYAYYSTGNLKSVTDPLGNSTTYQYNSYGQRTQVTDPLGKNTYYAYGTSGPSIGYLISATDANNKTTSFSTDSRGNILTSTNALPASTSFTYDFMDRVKSVTDPFSKQTQYLYDLSGNLAQVTDANGHYTASEYDLANRLTKATRPVDNTPANDMVERYAYDTCGNMLEVVDGENYVWRATYDDAGRLLSTSLPSPLNHQTSYQYDAAGRRIRVTEPGNHNTQYAYDLNGRLTSVSNQLGYVTRHRYDAMGRLLETENA